MWCKLATLPHCAIKLWRIEIFVSIYIVQISECELQYNTNAHSVKRKHLIIMYTTVELCMMVQFLWVRGGSATDSVRLFHNTYAANQLPDNSMVWRWGREFLTDRISLQDGAYWGKGALDDNFFTPTILSRSCPKWLLDIPMLKRHLGECFQTDAEVQSAVNAFFWKNLTKFYATGISQLIERYTKCLDQGDDYVEK